MLADASGERAATSRAPGPDAHSTSYRLAPPSASPLTHLPGAGNGSAPGVGTPTGFGPPTPRDAVPGPFAAPTAGPESPTRPVRGQGGRARTSVTIASSVVGTVLAGVLVWTLLPDGTHSDRGDTADSPEASSSRTKGPTSAPPRPSRSATVPRTDTKADLLTPAGIRTAVEAIKAATGADRAGDLAVYEDHVSADIMVKGSETKYDSYTYRPDRGVEKDIISGSLIGGERPFSLGAFDWDVVPALLKRAQKDLNVSRPTMRYVLVRPADDTFGTPLGLAVYRVDDHVTGYLTADLKGKVTRVFPAED